MPRRRPRSGCSVLSRKNKSQDAFEADVAAGAPDQDLELARLDRLLHVSVEKRKLLRAEVEGDRRRGAGLEKDLPESLELENGPDDRGETIVEVELDDLRSGDGTGVHHLT